MINKIVKIAKCPVEFSNSGKIVLIAGPCVIENEKFAISIAEKIAKIAQDKKIQLVFKASYDKANRTAITSFRGPGIKKGLAILAKIKKEFSLPILTDVHSSLDVQMVCEVADILQIPAFLCRQTDLLVAAAKTKKVVNVKKGQFLSPYEVGNIVEKIETYGNKNILLTERGFSFGYGNLVADMRSLHEMKKTSYPVIFDATHSVQMPGANGKSTGGNKEYIFPLARAASAVGIAGVFVEVHPHPSKALSDGPNSLSLSELGVLIEQLNCIDKVVKPFLGGNK